MGQYEWIILEVLFVALLVWELVRTRRAIRAARDAESGAKKAGTEGDGP